MFLSFKASYEFQRQIKANNAREEKKPEMPRKSFLFVNFENLNAKGHVRFMFKNLNNIIKS